MAKTPIPKFKSSEEEAEFWDVHDATDYFTFKRHRVKLTRGITVRLDDQTLAAIERRAQEQGIGPSTLVRVWLRERVSKNPKRHR